MAPNFLPFDWPVGDHSRLIPWTTPSNKVNTRICCQGHCLIVQYSTDSRLLKDTAIIRHDKYLRQPDSAVLHVVFSLNRS